MPNLNNVPRALGRDRRSADITRGKMVESGVAAKMRLFKINAIRRPINPPDASRKRAENVENEPVTEQTRTAEASDAEPRCAYRVSVVLARNNYRR